VPQVTLTSPTPGSSLETTHATWSYDETRTTFPQVRYAIEVATSTTDPAVATTEAASAATSAPLPEPPGGWTAGQKYYVRMRAASSPTTATPLLWSEWSAWGNFVPDPIPIDNTPPTTTSDATSSYNGTATISLSATDNAGGSGVADTYYMVDSLSTSGGSRSQVDSRTVVTFTSSGSLVCSGSLSGASVLVVGGGGGGGGTYYGGGGGGGQFLQGTQTLGGTMTVTVGSGGSGGTSNGSQGTPGSNGNDSVFGTITAHGGGGGGSGGGLASDGANGGGGGSGGGGGCGHGEGLYASTGQPNGYEGGDDTCPWAGAGGGGAGGTGSTTPENYHGGNGGSGLSSAISGSTAGYAGGGGGGGNHQSGSGANGGGAGGLSGPAAAGTSGTGGGGGGAGWNTGGAGGSGIVIINYPTSGQPQTGTTITIAPPASGTATHTVYFWSVDVAGNVEATHTATFTVGAYVPPALTGSVHVSAETTSSAWFTETDTNGDGLSDTPNNTNTGGRGSVSLSWPEVAGAATYNVYLLDGATYRQVGSTEATWWTSSGKGIYPTDSQIASMSVGTTGTPFLNGTGLDLRDDPTPLYTRIAGATVAGIPAYFFKVTAANAGGETTLSTQPATTVQLANRTKRAREAPAYTDLDLGVAAGDSVSVALNKQTLSVSATDLSINSYGPEASVSRVYDSWRTSSTYFAGGWRFNFETKLSGVPTSPIYCAADSRSLDQMVAAGTDVWVGPHSMVATLTRDPGTNTYALVFKGGDTQYFDSTGRLTKETDRRGDSVTYDWVAPGLVITAANGHQIIVTISGGKATSATYTRDGITRQVDYGASGVTRHLSASESVSVAYGYTAFRLSTIGVPGFAPGGVDALWTFSWTSTKLTGVHYPHSASIAERSVAITYDTTNTVASVSRPARVGVNASADTTVTETYVWDPTGRQIARGVPATSAASREGTGTIDYAPSGEARHSVTAAGVVSDSVTDARGNELITWDVDHHTTANVYNATDDLVSTTDPRGAVTEYTYNPDGDMLTERQQLNDTEWAQTTWDYTGDSHGRVQSETKAIDATTSVVTTYGGHGDFTEAGSVTEIDVALSATDTVGSDLTTQRTFDVFGQTRTETDPSSSLVASTTYDLSGRRIVDQDAAGTLTHHRYDVLGNEVETSRTAGAEWADWTSSTVDPTGLVLTAVSFVTSAGAVVPANTTTHTYDGSGAEIKAAVSDEGTATTAYDPKGDVAATWQPGVSTADTSTAQSTETDADSREVQSQLTTGTPAVTDYAPGDEEVVSYDPPGSAATTYTYDEAGNQSAQAVPVSSGTATETAEFDLAGRQTRSVDTSGNVTVTTYDLLGRVTATTLENADRNTTTSYNRLGWSLSQTDPDGVTKRNVYDANGRVTDSIVSVQGATDSVTHHTFDARGNETLTVNPDGTSIQTTFDAFGRATRRVETADGATVHNVVSDIDETGRTLESSDTVSAIRTATSFATSVSDIAVTTKTLPDATMTVRASAAGIESTRTFTVKGAPMGGLLTVSVKSRNGAQIPQMWKLSLPGVGGFYRTDVFDPQGRMEFQMDQTVGDYTYDPRTGLKTSESVWGHSLLPSQNSTYTYTDAGRLASARTNGTMTEYAYDPAGQIVSAGQTTFGYSAGELATSTIAGVTTTYSFDARGRRTGQSSPSQVATFTWDAQADRLTGYALDRAPLGSPDVAATFAYDASGQRTRSVVTSGGVTTTCTYVYGGLQLTRLASVTGSVTTTLTYLYDELARPLAIMASFSDTSGVYPVSPSVNAHGDVRGLMDLQMNALASWAYDAWGNQTSAATSGTTGYAQVPAAIAVRIAAIQPLRYAGYAYDEFSGLYYCSQRYFDPATMQFISRDPALSDAEGSAYQYCAGDPAGKTDPSGLSYNAAKAVAYSDKWWNSHNPQFPNNERKGGDCANFGSQCIWAGGIKMTGKPKNSGWWATKNGCSPKWENAHKFYKWTKKKWGVLETQHKAEDASDYWGKASAGDLIFLDYDNDGTVEHTTFCVWTYHKEGTYVNAHSTGEHTNMKLWNSWGGHAFLVRPR
jgi:RHS repeat-associated protein